MATVELDNLAKRFGSFTAVDDLNLTIKDGEFLVLLGPSGCGKSTTMRLIAGLEEPSSGEIRIDGKQVNDLPARDRDLAMVFQNYALYPHMTVGENIGYPLKLRRVPRAARQIQVNEAAAMVELEALLSRRPAELSGGQRQRVALARAIVRHPRLFLMDEPLSNLDARLRGVMRAELKHLQQKLGVTTVYVTHDQVEAMTLADRIVVMDQARIQQIGAPAQIYASPANTFVANFIGSPPMNLLAGRITDGKFMHSNSNSDISIGDLSEGSVFLGIRPENIQISTGSQASLHGTVYSSELLGDCTLLTVRCGNDLVSAKVGPAEGRNIGDTLDLQIDEKKMHLFDRDTGQRL